MITHFIFGHSKHRILRLFKASLNIIAIGAIAVYIGEHFKQKKHPESNEFFKNDAKNYYLQPNAIAQGTPFKITILKTQEDVEKARKIVPDGVVEGRSECIIGNFFADRRTPEQPNNVFCRTQQGMIIKEITPYGLDFNSRE